MKIILLFMSRIVISKIVNCLYCFNMLQSVMRILIFYGQTMLILASLNLLSSTPIIIWLLLLNVSLKLQIIVAKNCEKKESLFEILKLLAGIPWKVLYITPSICLLITIIKFTNRFNFFFNLNKSSLFTYLAQLHIMHYTRNF